MAPAGAAQPQLARYPFPQVARHAGGDPDLPSSHGSGEPNVRSRERGDADGASTTGAKRRGRPATQTPPERIPKIVVPALRSAFGG